MDSDRDRPHFRTSSSSSAAAATSDLFICFTSFSSSSSSMKLTKSILSPARGGREGGPVTLSSSVSRRLRSGSLKGGASPFLATTGKKRGCGFENPEPSSPKVTCIGQVRVKTKKKVKRSGSVSRRRSGEVSFRKMESSGDSNAQECLPPHRNQRWVHLPVSICEALRAEFSCLFPCKSSCFSTSGSGKQKRDESGCGAAVFARWLVSVNEGGGERKEIELVVGGGDEEEDVEEGRVSMRRRRSSRRHVFEDIEVKDDRIELKGQSLEGGEEEGARRSICIPPKNALLLMRCRSDPVKMAALANANRFSWDKNDIEEEEEENVVACQEQTEEAREGEVFEQEHAVLGQVSEGKEIPDEAAQPNLEVIVGEFCHDDEEMTIRSEQVVEEMVIRSEQVVEENGEELLHQQEILCKEESLEDDEEEEMVEEEEEEEGEEVESNMSSFEALLVQENTDKYQDSVLQDHHKEPEEEEMEDEECHLPPSTESDTESNTSQTPPLLQEVEVEAEAGHEEINETEEPSNLTEKDAILTDNKEENQVELELENGQEEQEGRKSQGQQIKAEKPRRQKVLPECLLLMMCEPKLSMEVSKETWVCSTDFIRWLPRKPTKADNEPRRLSIDSKPPRSSMATMIEQKLVNAVAYEPFVLTRCKSEPMRTAAAKLLPESCFWKNAMRKLEPHSRGVAADGIGF